MCLSCGYKWINSGPNKIDIVESSGTISLNYNHLFTLFISLYVWTVFSFHSLGLVDRRLVVCYSPVAVAVESCIVIYLSTFSLSKKVKFHISDCDQTSNQFQFQFNLLFIRIISMMDWKLHGFTNGFFQLRSLLFIIDIFIQLEKSY